jgi:hypothetical protein
MNCSLAVALAVTSIALSATSPSATRSTLSDQASAAARVADLAWIVGTWEGKGIDNGQATEVYSAAADGQLLGHFRQLKPDGSIHFYEIITIAEVGQSLEYRVKHFDADLSAWEEKGDVVRFPLIAVERNVWFFNGLTIRRDGQDAMAIVVRVGRTPARTSELVFRYGRKGSPDASK